MRQLACPLSEGLHQVSETERMAATLAAAVIRRDAVGRSEKRALIEESLIK